MSKLVSSAGRAIPALTRYSVPKLQTFWRYAKVELRPPTPSEIGQAAQGFRQVIKSASTGGYKNLTTKQAWLNTLIGMEIAFWFFAGECIGKGRLIGYYVPP